MKTEDQTFRKQPVTTSQPISQISPAPRFFVHTITQKLHFPPDRHSVQDSPFESGTRRESRNWLTNGTAESSSSLLRRLKRHQFKAV